MSMCIIDVGLFGVQAFVVVVESHKSRGELIIVVVGNATEVRFICEYISCCFEQKVVWVYCC